MDKAAAELRDIAKRSDPLGRVIEHGSPGQSWLTFRQALAPGGHVRKGERGTTVVYADRSIPDDERRRAEETSEEAQAIPFPSASRSQHRAVRGSAVGHCGGGAAALPPSLVEPRVEALINATGIDFRIGGDRAFYMPARDYVQDLPPQAYFEPINWQRTALHEVGHNADIRVMPASVL